MALITTDAILLRRYPFSESSQILRFFTGELGVVGVVAKGSRTRSSRGRGFLEPFSEGALTLYHRTTRDLQTFKDFAVSDAHLDLATDVLRFAGASLVCELVLRHTGEDANPHVFGALRGGLRRIEASERPNLAATILSEAWQVVAALGYGPDPEACVACGDILEAEAVGRFDASAGGVRCPSCAAGYEGPRIGPGARRQLRGLLEGRPPRPFVRPVAHLRLLGDFVRHHVSEGAALKSFGMLLALVDLEDA